MHLPAAAPRRHRIGLTPLIDVVFILLVFFMLASSLMDWRGLTLATGSGKPADPDSPPPARVTVLADGRLRLNDRVYPNAAAVATELRPAIDAGDVASVIVAPADDTRLGPTVAAFDALAGAGIDALALGRERR